MVHMTVQVDCEDSLEAIADLQVTLAAADLPDMSPGRNDVVARRVVNGLSQFMA
jgi:hypothetical protein